MSKPANPTELVDRYLQAVRFWMPKSRKQQELLAELGEDLRSQIEAKSEELGRPVTNDDVAEIVKRCGNPMTVAASLRPRSYLIGPGLYPIYIFVLKMVLLWILVPVFLFIVGPVNLSNSAGNWGVAIAKTVGDLWSGLFIAAGVITVVFAVLERTHALADATCKWDPMDLPPVEKESKTSLVHQACEMAFSFFGLIWILLLPTYPVLILGPAKDFLAASSTLHRFYLPVVLLGVLGLLRSAVALAKQEWDWFPHLSQLLQTFLTLLVLHFLLKAVVQVPATEWYPFVVLTDAARSSAHYIKVTALVNVSILIALAATWLGLCIAAPIQTWEFLSYLRKRASGLHQPLTLHMQ
jgi:hypothetical protein